MAISKKPAPLPQQEVRSPDEDAIKAVINKGGRVPAQNSAPEVRDEAQIKRLQLRLAPEWVARIDTLRRHAPIRPSRHAWILQAILEKLERDAKPEVGE